MTAPRPFLLLAPHLTWPARNGADLTHDALAESLSRRFPYVDVVGTNEIVRYRGGEVEERTGFQNRLRSRHAAALRTLLRASHFYAERFNTPAFSEQARRHLARPEYGVVLHSFVTTASLADLPDATRRHLAWTHNDEFAWFHDQAAASGFLARLVALFSARWLRRFIARHHADLTLLHVTEEDERGWQKHAPQQQSRVVPIGARVRGHAAPPLPPGAPMRLLFVGSLSVRMNLDALAHFADRYAPTLQARFGDALAVDVVGSDPLPDVVALCERQGWCLHPNVSDDALDALLARATATILPFAYSTGAKLKLLTSLAAGVPILGTSSVEAQQTLVQDPSLLSDDPSAWADRIAEIQNAGIDAETRARLRSIAVEHSWDASAARIVSLIDEAT